jgi:hypothetical protein
MGFYLRKSINFGGVRFNISKSGIGASVGVKGFRLGKSPRGNYIHMGRNGLYYRAALGQKKTKAPAPSSPSAKHGLAPPAEDYLFQDIESGDVSFIVDSSSQEIIDEITSKRKKLPFWLLSILFVFIPSAGLPLAILAGLLLYFLMDKKRKSTVLFYDIEEQIENEIQQFYNGFDELMHCNQAWHVSAQAAVRDRKYQAGANSVVRRSKIKIQYKIPPYIQTNVKVPMIPAGKQKLYFFPDRILIYERNKVGGLSYANLDIAQHNQRFIESGAVPRDGTIVDYTWQYVNKSGGPDKRFGNNRKLPILMYSDISFQSGTGLNELIQLSKQGAGIGLVRQLDGYKTKAFLPEPGAP